MKKYVAALLSLFSFPAIAGAGGAWLEAVPASAGPWQKWTEVPRDSFFEVPASKLATAESWLSDVAYLAQDPSGVSYFGRSDFACIAPKTPYLVRASFVHGGTGEFRLYLTGTELIVAHGSLGPPRPASKSALVVCLASEPTAIFSSLSTAL